MLSKGTLESEKSASLYPAGLVHCAELTWRNGGKVGVNTGVKWRRWCFSRGGQGRSIGGQITSGLSGWYRSRCHEVGRDYIRVCLVGVGMGVEWGSLRGLEYVK